MITATKQRLRYVVGDYLTTSLAWFVFNIIRYVDIVIPIGGPDWTLGQFLMIKPVILGQIIIPVLMLGIYWLSGYYNQVFFKSRMQELLTTISTAAIGTVLIYFIAIIDDPIPDRISNYHLLLMLMLLMTTFVYALRLFWTTLSTRNIHARRWTLNALIIGCDSGAVALFNRLNRDKRHSIYNVKAFASIGNERPEGKLPLPVVPLSEIEKTIDQEKIKYLIIASDNITTQETLSIVNSLYRFRLPVLVSPTMFPFMASKNKLTDIAGEPLIDITDSVMSPVTVNMKRFSDIVLSAIGMVVLMPLYAAIALAVKLDSRGPVLYRQERIGLHKKPFKIIKFRTMKTDAEADGPALSSANDPRITRVGKVLRKYRLDEFPQFWNVLRGDMSLVGPRPERAYFINQIVERAPHYTLIHQVRPGITSWGMVKHGYASTVDDMIKRMRYDILYIENISLQVDLKILFYTVNTVITGRGL